MPAWMASLHAALCAEATPLYARLFLVKVVLHVDRRHTDRAATEAAAAAGDALVCLCWIFNAWSIASGFNFVRCRGSLSSIACAEFCRIRRAHRLIKHSRRRSGATRRSGSRPWWTRWSGA